MHNFFFSGGQKLVKKLLAEAFARQKKYLHSKTAEKKSCKDSRFDVQVFFWNCPNPPPPYYLGVDIRNKHDYKVDNNRLVLAIFTARLNADIFQNN